MADDFDTVFEQLAQDAAKSVAEPPAPPVAEPPAPPAPPVAEPPAPPVVVPPESPPAAAPPAPPAAEPPVPPAPPVETPEQVTAREAFEASIKPYEPTEEEKQALAKMKEDFPNEYAAMETRLKSVDRDINARVHAAVVEAMKSVDTRLAPVEQTVSITAFDAHMNALHTAHPDFDALVPKVKDWIGTQPEYVRPALQAVYDRGTTKDVISLFADYKKATGSVVTPPPEVPSPAAKPAGADDLAPVSVKRAVTGPKGVPDKNDLEGAWAELSAADK